MTKMTKLEIKREIDTLKDNLDDLRRGNSDPKVKKALAIYQKAMVKYDASREAYAKSIKEKITKMESEIAQMEEEFRKPSRKTITTAIPDDKLSPLASKILLYCKRNYEGGKNTTIIWQSESGNIVITKDPGGMYWSGRSEQSYGKTIFTLIDARCMNDDHTEPMIDGKLLEFEGRMNKPLFNEWTQKAIAYEKRHKKYLRPQCSLAEGRIDR